jgi:hypothetical protein
MMYRYVHPVSSVPVDGIRLGPGAVVRATDYFEGTPSWLEAGPTFAGSVIQPGCQILWVRPNIEMSTEARRLLGYLIRDNQYLTDFGGTWRRIPAPEHKTDGRMDWYAEYGAVQELKIYGLIAPMSGDDQVYEATDVGRTIPQTD